MMSSLTSLDNKILKRCPKGDPILSKHYHMLAMLNTEVWVEGNKVWYEHYRKPMANDLLMLEISAMPAKIKRATLTQEVVTIRRNISPDLPWSVTVKHLNNFCQRMKASGYNENY